MEKRENYFKNQLDKLKLYSKKYKRNLEKKLNKILKLFKNLFCLIYPRKKM